jgi:hypothetical protein
MRVSASDAAQALIVSGRPGASLVPPCTVLPADIFAFFGALSAYGKLRFSTLAFVVSQKGRFG